MVGVIFVGRRGFYEFGFVICFSDFRRLGVNFRRVLVFFWVRLGF